jgi:hypothetical protein
MQVTQLPVVNAIQATMSSLVPARGRVLTNNRPRLFDLNFRMFFQQGLRQQEFDQARRYVCYLDRAQYERDQARRRFLDDHLGPTWPTRFGLPRLNVPFLVFRSLARDLEIISKIYVWERLRSEPDSVEEYL